jgi:hypothetical protein
MTKSHQEKFKRDGNAPLVSFDAHTGQEQKFPLSPSPTEEKYNPPPEVHRSEAKSSSTPSEVPLRRSSRLSARQADVAKNVTVTPAGTTHNLRGKENGNNKLDSTVPRNPSFRRKVKRQGPLNMYNPTALRKEIRIQKHFPDFIKRCFPDRFPEKWTPRRKMFHFRMTHLKMRGFEAPTPPNHRPHLEVESQCKL